VLYDDRWLAIPSNQGLDLYRWTNLRKPAVKADSSPVREKPEPHPKATGSQLRGSVHL
jgi:hypothetical protein